eukprot:TRINITY_DN2025_c0_g2_i2.p2 TRINITY_DN2025_c0_g2~~TRINITY_DN2025_c0_g2_i2.p2  ORF type:complete len:501 (+),score=130.32 TRINITY_DN2025_c0_g2_i2:1879-3381(+)
MFVEAASEAGKQGDRVSPFTLLSSYVKMNLEEEVLKLLPTLACHDPGQANYHGIEGLVSPLLYMSCGSLDLLNSKPADFSFLETRQSVALRELKYVVPQTYAYDLRPEVVRLAAAVKNPQLYFNILLVATLIAEEEGIKVDTELLTVLPRAVRDVVLADEARALFESTELSKRIRVSELTGVMVLLWKNMFQRNQKTMDAVYKETPTAEEEQMLKVCLTEMSLENARKIEHALVLAAVNKLHSKGLQEVPFNLFLDMFLEEKDEDLVGDLGSLQARVAQSVLWGVMAKCSAASGRHRLQSRSHCVTARDVAKLKMHTPSVPAIPLVPNQPVTEVEEDEDEDEDEEEDPSSEDEGKYEGPDTMPVTRGANVDLAVSMINRVAGRHGLRVDAKQSKECDYNLWRLWHLLFPEPETNTQTREAVMKELKEGTYYSSSETPHEWVKQLLEWVPDQRAIEAVEKMKINIPVLDPDQKEVEECVPKPRLAYHPHDRCRFYVLVDKE